MLLLIVNFSNICPAFTTTVYAFLNPKLPSAAWDFFACDLANPVLCLLASCAKLSVPLLCAGETGFFDYY
jgi:hypothetical protein